MKKLIFFCLAFTLTIGFGCSKTAFNRGTVGGEYGEKYDDMSNDDYLVATQLMDSHRVSEAIRFIESKDLTNHPQKSNLVMVLASAYGELGGVSTPVILDAIKNLEDNKKDIDKLMLGSEFDHGAKSTNVGRVLSELLIFSKQVHKYMALVKGIPVLKKDQLPYIEKSIKILKQKEDLTAGQALFKASLEMVLIRQVVTFYLVGNIETAVANPLTCTINVSDFYDLSLKIRYLSDEVIQDLKKALPSNKEKLTKFHEELIQQFDNVSNHLLLIIENENPLGKFTFTPELSSLDLGKIFICQ